MVALRNPFRVPFARGANGALVTPEEARKGRAYACPECGGEVDLHAGERKRRHFHHRGGAIGSCTPESVVHLTAKLLIVAAVEAWRAGGDAPLFVRRCATDGCEARVRQAMPAKVRHAVPEHRLPTGRVVDVALLGAGDLVIAAVEVRHTHEVDDEKAREMGAPWIEVEASQVCEAAGRVLVPIEDRFLAWLCDEHAPERRSRAKARLDDVQTRTALLRGLAFRVDDYPGFRVEGVGRCEQGHDALVFAWDGDEPPWPRPPLVVARERERDRAYSRAQGRVRDLLPFRREWRSVCGRCGALVRDA
jgi:hypothetical protein